MFAVVVTGPPGSGKTVTVTALVDALGEDGIPHAAVDVDEVAWAFPYPDLAQRCEHLRVWRVSHERAGATLFIVAEVVESQAHLADLLVALGADDHLLVRLEAKPVALRERIVAREPDGWFGLDRLLGETERLQVELPLLDGVHLVLDSERLTPVEIAQAIRELRPEVFAPRV